MAILSRNSPSWLPVGIDKLVRDLGDGDVRQSLCQKGTRDPVPRPDTDQRLRTHASNQPSRRPARHPAPPLQAPQRSLKGLSRRADPEAPTLAAHQYASRVGCLRTVSPAKAGATLSATPRSTRSHSPAPAQARAPLRQSPTHVSAPPQPQRHKGPPPTPAAPLASDPAPARHVPVPRITARCWRSRASCSAARNPIAGLKRSGGSTTQIYLRMT